MSDLKQHLIKLGNAHPELRPHLKRVLTYLTKSRQAQASRSSREWGVYLRELIRSAPQVAQGVLSRRDNKIQYDYPTVPGLTFASPNSVKVSGSRVIYTSQIVSKPLTSTVYAQYDKQRGTIETVYGKILSEKKTTAPLGENRVEVVEVKIDLTTGLWFPELMQKIIAWGDRTHNHSLWNLKQRSGMMKGFLDADTITDPQEFLAGLNCPGASVKGRMITFDPLACL